MDSTGGPPDFIEQDDDSLTVSENDFFQLIESLPYGVYIVKPDRTIVYWNREAECITGYGAEEMVGRRCPDTELNHMDEEGTPLCKTYCPLLACMDEKRPEAKKLVLTHKKGYMIAVQAHFIPLKDEMGRLKLVAEVFTPIRLMNRETRIVENLYSMAYHDALTKLPNRLFLEAVLKTRFSEYHRLHEPFAVLFADIDHFHEFNEEYGHQAGDEILKTFAETVLSHTRKTDTIGRWGGEEFIGIYPIKNQKDILPIAARFQEIVSQAAVKKDKGTLHITMSVGITAVTAEDTLKSIIDRADRFMFEAKRRGRNTIVHDEIDGPSGPEG